VDLFSGNEWEAFLKIEAQLSAKNTDSTRACAVGFGSSIFENVFQKAFILVGLRHGTKVKF
jgi:hypothetical protein